MKFQKGKSGNPNGRPKIELADGRTLAAIARDYTPDAVAAIIDVMMAPDTPYAVKIKAATALIDRGWGCPKTNLNTSRFVPISPEKEKEYWRFIEREVLGL